MNRSHDTGDIEDSGSGVWFTLTTYVESVKGVGAVGAVLKEVFLSLGEFLTGFILAESETSSLYPGRLDGEYQVVIILTVEIRGETASPLEAEVYEVIFLVMAHRVAKVNGYHSPAVHLELSHDSPAEIDVIDGVVGSECC